MSQHKVIDWSNGMVVQLGSRQRGFWGDYAELSFEDVELRYLWDLQAVPCGKKEVRNTGVYL